MLANESRDPGDHCYCRHPWRGLLVLFAGLFILTRSLQQLDLISYIAPWITQPLALVSITTANLITVEAATAQGYPLNVWTHLKFGLPLTLLLLAIATLWIIWRTHNGSFPPSLSSAAMVVYPTPLAEPLLSRYSS